MSEPVTGKFPDNFVSRLRKREHEAFNELVRLCHGSVFGLARRLLHDVDDAQEVSQDTFLAAYEGIDGFQERANIRTWLLSIGYRKGMDRLRRRIEEGKLLSGGFDEAEMWKIAQNVDEFTDWGRNPEQYVNRNQVFDGLERALKKIPAESRAVFELRDLQGFSSKEVSEVLGLNEGAVRVRLHRVRQLLMRELQSFFENREARS